METLPSLLYSTSPNEVANLFLLADVELSIKPELNYQLVPPHARAELDVDLDSFVPMRREDLRVSLD